MYFKILTIDFYAEFIKEYYRINLNRFTILHSKM